ncbi:Adenylosuccinate synthase [Fusarium piperis]|uniref:Adenylosuccinate synthetase n=1 Tax=Fusarium piperis TaxID=1435070 RepID=A0A9W8TFA4_9HYPO|nr:Adenylosuccinate synthase [Fusarium piperis]
MPDTRSFHLLPSGLINPKCMNFIGTSVVFHVPSFFKELKELEDLPNVYDRILVSDRVHIDFDLHAAVDGLEEIELGERKVGTTGKGIGPSYSTKAARSGIRLSEVFDEELFESKLRRLAAGYAKRYGDLLKYDVEEEIARFKEYRPKLAKHAVDAVAFMSSAQESNTNILIEGANPYVTSSSTCLGGCIAGLALNPTKIEEVIGVVKAYTTRVGSGPFPTEDLSEEVGGKLQEVGREWGTTTGRRHLVVVKYSTAINHYTALNLTKLDVLDGFKKIKIAIAYKDENGEDVPSFPADLKRLESVKVVYHEMDGWMKPTTNAKHYYDLPKQARDYIEFIEKFIGVKVKWIGTGPSREAMVKRA